MALFEKKMRTSQQKAQRAQMGILARFLGCGYLIYIMVQLIQTTLRDESTANVKLQIGIAIFFLLASGVIITITAIEFVRNYKGGLYRPAAYTDDFEPEDDAEPVDAIEGGAEDVTEVDDADDEEDDIDDDEDADDEE